MKYFQKMNKGSFYFLVFICVVIGTAFLQYRNSLPVKKSVPVIWVNVKQRIINDDDSPLTPIRVQMGTTALQLLQKSHKVLTKGERENAFITSIDGRLALETEKEFWSFYVNGNQAKVGAGSYKVRNNDTIEWKIETY